MADKEILSKLVQYECYFKASQYEPFIKRARNLLDEGCEKGCQEVLNSLPSEKELLEDVVDKLKDKPVYKTLKRGLKEGGKQDITFLKGLFSLGTHIVIECEHGHPEYKILLPTLHARIGRLMQEI